jgi:diaminopimelate decarboxylase
MPLPLPLDVDALEAVVADFGTPLQLYDEDGIRQQVRYLLSSARERLPDFAQFYAVKALPNPAILRIVLGEGCGLDCSSLAELNLAKVREPEVLDDMCMLVHRLRSVCACSGLGFPPI